MVQISEEVAAHLKEAGVEVKGYEDVAEDVKSVAVSGTKLWMDPSKVPPPLPSPDLNVAENSRYPRGSYGSPREPISPP